MDPRVLQNVRSGSAAARGCERLRQARLKPHQLNKSSNSLWCQDAMRRHLQLTSCHSCQAFRWPAASLPMACRAGTGYPATDASDASTDLPR
eukprot:650458-Alexandrium_andersonii.AAC.1